MNYTQHPLSAAFPSMGDEEYQALKDSIENIGVQNAITIYEGQILDGWHRYRAAYELGMDCPTAELDSEVDPREFVIAQNKSRRHLTKAQFAMAAASVYEWKPHGTNRHTNSRAAPGAGLEGQQNVNSSTGAQSKTHAEIAQVAGVSERTVRQAKAVREHAAPEVIAAVESGEIGLRKAEQIAKLPKEEQAKAIKEPMPKHAPEPEELPPGITPEDAAEIEAIQQQEMIDSIPKLIEENEQLRATIESLKADDQKAETLKYRRMYEHANRRMQEEQKAAYESRKRADFFQGIVTKCSKLMGLKESSQLFSAVKRLMGGVQ